MQLLELLLRQPGELVTREEIRQHLWPNGTVVEFEHSVNAAVKRLREALGDDADKPTFIETIPRRGYRFIAQVSDVRLGTVIPETQTAAPPVRSQLSPTNGDGRRQTTVEPGNHKLKPARQWTVVWTVAVLTVLMSATVFRLRSTARPPVVRKYSQLTSDGQYKEGLFTDGSRLYFTMAKSGRLTVAQMSAAGGPVSPLPLPFEQVTVSDINPDGSSLLVHPYAADEDRDESKAAYVVSLPDGTPRRIGGDPFLDASWSPDGRWIAYRQDTDLYVAASDGSGRHKVAAARDAPLWPRWSPDGKLLRFSTQIGWGNFSLWEVQTDGTHIHELFSGWNSSPSECCGDWTADGRYFLFRSSRGVAPKGTWPSSIWAVREKNKYFGRVDSPVQITVGSAGTSQFISAAPSRDGKRLFVIGGNERYELVRYDKRSKSFLPFLAGVNGIKFSFSRDGQWVTYVNIADNTLWRGRVDGSDRLQLTFPPMNAGYIHSWSPDGNEIAFAASMPGGPAKIFRISRDGGSPEQLTEGKHRRGEVSPSWSPDGKTLVFGEYSGENSNPDSKSETSPQYIWLLELQTRKLTALPGSAKLFRPAWSPDGRYIAAHAPSGSLLIFDFATQKWSEIVKPPNEWCVWSRDGKKIQYGSMVNGEPVLKRVRVSDRKVETVTTLKALNQLGFDNYYNWLGIAPDDSPLAIRDASSFDIYALDWELP